jgi:hypothetical protein
VVTVLPFIVGLVTPVEASGRSTADAGANMKGGPYPPGPPSLLGAFDKPFIDLPHENGISWNVSLVGEFDSRGYANGVAVSGDYAFVADYDSGMCVIDISDPGSPLEVGRLRTSGIAWNVAVHDGYAYIAERTRGLTIVDVSDPTHPVETGNFDTIGYSLDVAVEGHYAYLADHLGGLRIIDVSDPSDPREVGSYDTIGYTCGVAVKKSLAYITDYHMGLRIIDVSDPEHPEEIGHLDTDGYALDVTVHDDLAFVADYFDGLRIIDVSDPEHPFEAGFYYTSGNTYGVAVEDETAYLADYHRGLRILDVSNVASPVEIGYYDTGGFAMSVVEKGKLIYVADGDDGLFAFEFHPDLFALACPADTVIASFSTYPEHILDGFTITNTSASPHAYTFEVTSEGPCELTDGGDPAALQGTTPELPPGGSFTPPAAVLAVPAIREFTRQFVTYKVGLAGEPGVIDSCTTILTFEAPLATTIEEFRSMPSTSGVLLQWRVTGDEPVAGFMIYRNGTSINRFLLPPETSEFLDRSPVRGETADYVLGVVLESGSETRSAPLLVTLPAGDIVLEPNFPNPFNPSTSLRFHLPSPMQVDLSIFDVKGKRVTTLVHDLLPAGDKVYVWNGRNDRGIAVASGVYVCRLKAGKTVLKRRMVLTR